MAMLDRQLSVNISVAKVDRFGKTYFNLCLIFVFIKWLSPDKTIIPSNSGKKDLEINILFWPETNIGEAVYIVSCPCGNDSSGGQILQASRYCGGNFTSSVEWSKGNVAVCNFSDLARKNMSTKKCCLLDVNTGKQSLFHSLGSCS